MKMYVNRSLLEKKTNAELEEYVKPESRSVSEAIEYAYEILKSRGREFSEEETIRLQNIFERHKIKIAEIVHPNYTKAANLMYISGGLGLINMFLVPATLNSGGTIFIGVVAILFVMGLGFLISKGFEWMKYVLLSIFILGLLGIPMLLISLFKEPVSGVISLLQLLFQLGSLLYLFKVPTGKPKEGNFRE